MLCQIILQEKQINILVRPGFQTTGGGNEERSQAVDFLYFLFSSDIAVNSVEIQWMCFHLSRMMADVGCCSKSFFPGK